MRRFPIVYEINTWVWLGELSKKHKRKINLNNIPSKEWEYLASFGFDALWLMGVWQRSPVGVQIALEYEEMVNQFRTILPDFTPKDLVGSPYCIKTYTVDTHLGGPNGLATARNELKKRGMGLILDFVPNHVAPDHPWTINHLDYFIKGTLDESLSNPSEYYMCSTAIFAKARDPYYPPWPDVIQLNAFSEGYRQASLNTISSIAEQCDGIRCDMAMLMTNRIFSKTWGDKAGLVPESEYWDQIIPEIKQKFPHFLFIGEVYWDMEWEMMQQGFDYCYDKRLYDRIMSEPADNIRQHLNADIHFQSRLVRFIENHDEPRIASKFDEQRNKTAALTFSTLPGMRLFHEGQLDGKKTKLPVFLGRRPEEKPSEPLLDFYSALIKLLQQSVFHDGEWKSCTVKGWDDNQSAANLLGWTWTNKLKRIIVVVNLSEYTSQGNMCLPWTQFQNEIIELIDPINDEQFESNSNEIIKNGLYVELPPYSNHILFVE